MTLTLELPAESQQLLQHIAAERGQTMEELASALIHDRLQEMQDLEEDKIDLLESREIRRVSDPAERRTLDDWKAHIEAQKTLADAA